MQLKALWSFMQVDMEADRFENAMRQSENRQKLLKQRNFLKEQQTNIKKIEAEVAAMADRLAAVEDDISRLSKVLEGLNADIEANPPQTPEEVEARTEAVQKVLETLSRYEQEVTKMSRDAAVRDRQQHDIRLKAAKTKADFDALKAVYDKEYERDSEQLRQLRARTEQEAKKIDADLLARYHAIKQHCTPPMAKLVNGQCSGCFMSLPSASILALKDGDRIIECDNCGRIIYIDE